MGYRGIIAGALFGAGVYLGSLFGSNSESADSLSDYRQTNTVENVVANTTPPDYKPNEDILPYSNVDAILQDYHMGELTLGQATNYMNQVSDSRHNTIQSTLDSLYDQVNNIGYGKSSVSPSKRQAMLDKVFSDHLGGD